MPLPLKDGYNFNYAHAWRPPFYEMSSAEAYTDFYGLSFLINGDVLSYSTECATILREGDITFTPKYCYFRSTYISDKPREQILIKFTDSMVSELLPILGVDNFNDYLIDHPTNIHLTRPEQEKVSAIMKEIEKEWNAYNEYSEILLKGLLHQLIILLLKEHDTGEAKPLPDRKKNVCLFNAIDYVKAHLQKSPSLKETAEYAKISASYLSKIFVSHLHTPYSSFLLNEKILYAQKLLVSTSLTMEEIADKAGFSSNTYFSDCFRKKTGTTPLQFRKSYR